MAKRRHYYHQQRVFRRRLIMAGLFVIIVCVGVWRFYLDPLLNSKETGTVAKAQQPVISVPANSTVAAPQHIHISEQIEHAVSQSSEKPARLITTLPRKNDQEVSEIAFSSAQPVTKPVEKPIIKKPIQNAGLNLLKQGRQAIMQKDYIKARQLLSDAVSAGLTITEEKQARKLINQASDEWLFSKNIFENDPYCSRYKVQTGDMFATIGKKFKVPYQLLMKINGIHDAARLRAGQNLKVIQGPFQVKVKRSTYTMSVYLDDLLVRSYIVGLGAPGRQTPTGLWRVTPGRKQVNPAWDDVEEGKHYYPDDPENPLGERWIAIEGIEGDAVGRTGFGIHGTIKPHEIGKSASRGCIRLHNKDVEELYDLLQEGDTTVRVIN